ncbi:MAG: nitroreductase family protein [Merdibacter sp.]
MTNAFYDAPTVITLFLPRRTSFLSQDCAVAAENMMLVADTLGIGSCYIGRDGRLLLILWAGNCAAGCANHYYAVMQLLLGYRERPASRA